LNWQLRPPKIHEWTLSRQFGISHYDDLALRRTTLRQVIRKPFKRLIPPFSRSVHLHHVIAHLSRREYHTQCELGLSSLFFECPSVLKLRAGVTLLALAIGVTDPPWPYRLNECAMVRLGRPTRPMQRIAPGAAGSDIRLANSIREMVRTPPLHRVLGLGPNLEDWFTRRIEFAGVDEVLHCTARVNAAS